MEGGPGVLVGGRRRSRDSGLDSPEVLRDAPSVRRRRASGRSFRAAVETEKGVKGYGPGGGSRDWVQFDRATPNSPSAEMFLPAPGGPDLVYHRYEEDNNLTTGPEGILTRPSDGPGFGWDLEPAG